MLSSRGATNLAELRTSFRYAPSQDYDAETNPGGLISFGLAENKPMIAEMTRFVNEKVKFTEDSISYRLNPSTSERLLKAVAAHLNKALQPQDEIIPGHVFVADSVTSLGNMLGQNLADSGDGILVSRPIYGRFELDYGIEARVKIVYADTSVDEAFTPSLAVQKYEEAFIDAKRRGIKIRAILLVNPHNPTGRCYTKETLRAIAMFCQRYDLHLISDEIYASCIFDSGEKETVGFSSITSINLQEVINPEMVHLQYGFSKDFATGGLHLGILVTRNHLLRQSCQVLQRLHNPSNLAATVGIAILEDESFMQRFIAQTRRSLASCYHLTASILTQRGINYIRGGNAGFFVYVDFTPYLCTDASLSPREKEIALAQRFLDAGVFLHPGEEHSQEAGWFRLVFTQEEETLREGLRRYGPVLDL